jgi:hypothetical protein
MGTTRVYWSQHQKPIDELALTIWETIEYTCEEPFALLTHELDVVVCGIRASSFAFCIGHGEDVLSFRISERNMYVPMQEVSCESSSFKSGQ